jgi:hypothetical protein
MRWRDCSTCHAMLWIDGMCVHVICGKGGVAVTMCVCVSFTGIPIPDHIVHSPISDMRYMVRVHVMPC